MAVYNVATISAIGVTCTYALSNSSSSQASYTIVCLCIILCNTVTLCLVFLPKVRVYFHYYLLLGLEIGHGTIFQLVLYAFVCSCIIVWNTVTLVQKPSKEVPTTTKFSALSTAMVLKCISTGYPVERIKSAEMMSQENVFLC